MSEVWTVTSSSAKRNNHNQLHSHHPTTHRLSLTSQTSHASTASSARASSTYTHQSYSLYGDGHGSVSTASGSGTVTLPVPPLAAATASARSAFPAFPSYSPPSAEQACFTLSSTHHNNHYPQYQFHTLQQQQYNHALPHNLSNLSSYSSTGTGNHHHHHSTTAPPLVHPSPVRAHSYPFHHHPFNESASSASSGFDHHSLHLLPSPPLSTSTMPDPWGAERTPDEDDTQWVPNANGSPASSPLHHAHAPAKAKTKRLPAPQAIEVWASLMDKSKGRDKVLKCVQYTLKTYLYVLGLISTVRPLRKWFISNRVRAQLAVSGLSLTRKCLLLLNPLRPAAALLSSEPTSARDFLGHLIDLIGAVSDDVFCLSRLGLVSRKKGRVADRWANRIWFTNTLTGLYALQVKSRRPRDPEQVTRDEWTARKLLCDLVFVSYDIFNLSWAKEPVQCCVGLLAAFISTGTLYNNEWNALNKRIAA